MPIRHQNTPASYLVLRQDQKILLLRRFNTGYEDGNYSMVAGHVDPKETFSQCIIREAREEAGIIVQAEDLKLLHIMHRDSKEEEYNERIDIFFETSKWQGQITNLEPQKCDDLSWFDLNNLPENIIPYIRHVIEAITRGEIYSEFGWEK